MLHTILNSYHTYIIYTDLFIIYHKKCIKTVTIIVIYHEILNKSMVNNDSLVLNYIIIFGKRILFLV